MSYRLALLSAIPLVRRADGSHSLDLWVRDLQAQVDAVQRLVLFAPYVHSAPADWAVTQPLPESIDVVDVETVGPAALRTALQSCDVVQIPGNFSWGRSAVARRFVRLARALGKPVIVGISSDRAKTELMNAKGSGLLRRARSWWRFASIRLSQTHLVRRAAGTFVVGEGLRRLAAPWTSRLLVGTASWIRLADIKPPRDTPDLGKPVRLGAAARLEHMKGTHLAIEAVHTLRLPQAAVRCELDIAGIGPEEPALRALVAVHHLTDTVRFVGSLPYPGPFFEWLNTVDIVVLTNLNDEQPRLVFDAISQGCLIVCPDSLPYRGLGLPPSLLYLRGDAAALSACLLQLIAVADKHALRRHLRAIAEQATIETMHVVRRDWVVANVLR